MRWYMADMYMKFEKHEIFTNVGCFEQMLLNKIDPD